MKNPDLAQLVVERENPARLTDFLTRGLRVELRPCGPLKITTSNLAYRNNRLPLLSYNLDSLGCLRGFHINYRSPNPLILKVTKNWLKVKIILGNRRLWFQIIYKFYISSNSFDKLSKMIISESCTHICTSWSLVGLFPARKAEEFT